jgi:hypothetical protein
MEPIMRDAGADVGGELREFNGQAHHVPLLVNFPPAIAISWPVNSLKGRVLPQAAAGARGPARPQLTGQAAAVTVVRRRVGRWRAHQRPAPAPSSKTVPSDQTKVRPPSPPA